MYYLPSFIKLTAIYNVTEWLVAISFVFFEMAVPTQTHKIGRVQCHVILVDLLRVQVFDVMHFLGWPSTVLA